jgi:succinoglycan biosynthesis transport protein ExoP
MSERDQQIVPYESVVDLAQRSRTPYTVLDSASFDQPIALAVYWRMLLRRRWTILTIVAVITTLVAIVSFKTKPVYRATARVQIDSETPQIDSLQQLYQQMPTDEDFLRTEIQVLKTDQLSWRTIEQLGLQTDPTFAESKPSPDFNRRKQDMIHQFQKQLTAELVPSSRIIRVSFDSTNPQLASRVANGLVNNFIDYNFRVKYDATREATARMEQQLDEMKAQVEKSQQALVEYQREHAIANINDKQNLVNQQLGELSANLSRAQADRFQKEALYNVVRTDPSQIAAIAQTELLQRLQEKYADLNNQYTEALNQYGPNYPKVVRLQKQVAEVQTLIQKERDRVLNKIRNDYTAAQAQERLIATEVARQKEEVANLNNLMVEQNILAGEFESNQKMYQSLLQHLKDATVSAGLRSTNVHLVDPALAPVTPIRPKKLQNIILAALSSMILGMVLVLVQESMDHSVKSADEAEVILGAPMLATVPAMERIPRRMASRSMPSPGSPAALAILKAPKSPIAEAYRALRTSVLLSLPDGAHRTLLITSANAGEGKTCTAINLAMSLGQRGESVLLLECDLRRPSIARVLGIDGRKGLSTVLTDRHTVEEAIQSVPQAPSVSILAAGPVAYGPAELLSSPKMNALVRELAQQFSYIVLDSPPMLAVTDASILASMADGILVVVEGGATARRALSQVRRLAEVTGARLLGLVLNKIDARQGEYYGYYGRNYGYVYGTESRSDDSASSAMQASSGGEGHR